MEAAVIATTQMTQDMFYQAFSETLVPQAKQDMECKVLKRQRSSSPELLRCKRRLTFNGLGYTIPQQQPMAVARRNERERNRVKQVNMGFQTLRQHVPNGAANKKMSKVETLRSAVEYIRALQQLLDEHDAVSAVLQCGVPSPSVSNMYSAGSESPHSAYSSDEGSYEHLSSEEQELLDFTTWFDRYESGRWQFLSVFHFYRPRDPQLSAPLFKKSFFFFISNTLLHEQHYTQRVQNTLFFVWMDRITVIFVYTGDSLLFYSITGASLSTKDWC